MADYTPTTAAGWLDKALHFIETHPHWVLQPGQDLHGWLVQARKLLAEEKAAEAKRLDIALRAPWQSRSP